MYLFALQSHKFHALKEIGEAKKEGKWPREGSSDGCGGIHHRVELAPAQVEGLGLSTVEGPCTSAPEDSELVAGFVDGAVAVDPLRNSQCRATRAGGGDQFGSGTRAEAGKMRGVVPRR